jgi:hypothetical protein
MEPIHPDNGGTAENAVPFEIPCRRDPAETGRLRARLRGEFARRDIAREGGAARRRIARFLASLPMLLLVAALRAAVVFAFLSLGCCAGPLLEPGGAAEILDVRDEPGVDGCDAVLTYRVSVGKDAPTERFGVTIRLKTQARTYWGTDIVEQRMPAGASVTSTMRLTYASADERYVEESAMVEKVWFE